MKRREAIKNLSLGIGYVVSAPAVLGILESCSKQEPNWQPVFLSDSVKPAVTHLVDVILPSSDSPGGLDLGLPQFIDKMCADILSESDREWVTTGGALFLAEISSSNGGETPNASREAVLRAFKTYFDLPADQKQAVMGQQRHGAGDLRGEEKDRFAIYKFLFTIREFALLGYFTSEKIGKEYLVFDPIPGGYKPCIPLSEVGNAWTIG